MPEAPSRPRPEEPADSDNPDALEPERPDDRNPPYQDQPDRSDDEVCEEKAALTTVSVHIDPAPRRRPRTSADTRRDHADETVAEKVRQQPTPPTRDRPASRSPHSRSSAVADRPHNLLRSAATADRTHNSRRHQAESITGRAEDRAAHHRSSRVGRHHADRTAG